MDEVPRLNRDVTVDERERVATEFFALNTRFVLTGQSPNNLLLSRWVDYTLVSSITEPALRHAVAALGTAHMSTGNVLHTSLQRPIDKDKSHFTATLYGRSVVQLQRLVDRALEQPWLVEAVVLCCTILFILELYRGNDAAAVRHTRAGKRILQQHLKGQLPIPGSTMQYVHAGSRLAGSDPLSRAPHALGRYSCLAARTPEPLVDTVQRSALAAKIVIGERLETIIREAEDIQSELLEIATKRLERIAGQRSPAPPIRYCLIRSLSRSIPLVDQPDLEVRLRKTQQDFIEWRRDTTLFIQNRSLSAGMTMLQLRFFSSMFHLATSRTTTESDIDQFRDDFVQFLGIVDTYFVRLRLTRIPADSAAPVIEQPHNVGLLDASIVATLLTVAGKCRDSTLRHRAIGMLQCARRVEGIHAIPPLEVLAATTVQLEEEMTARFWRVARLQSDQPLMWTAELVPEQARFSDVVLSIDDQQGAGTCLVCAYSVRGPDGSIRLLETKRTRDTAEERSEYVYYV